MDRSTRIAIGKGFAANGLIRLLEDLLRQARGLQARLQLGTGESGVDEQRHVARAHERRVAAAAAGQAADAATDALKDISKGVGYFKES